MSFVVILRMNCSHCTKHNKKKDVTTFAINVEYLNVD